VSSLVKRWLNAVPWSSVTAINASLCQAKSAVHKPTSEGHEAARSLWEKNRSKELSLQELLQLCVECHRLAPFCNYNGNTFVAVVKTLLTDTLSRMPADEAHVLRSIAGHIVAGTAANIETKQLDRILKGLKT